MKIRRRLKNLRQALANRDLKGGDLSLPLYALESFATNIDDEAQKHLLTQLVLDHASLSQKIERLVATLKRSERSLEEAQKIASLGRWDVNIANMEQTWSRSLYDILELDHSLPASRELFLSLVHPEDYQTILALYENLSTYEESFSMRYRLKLKNGMIKWVHLRLNSLKEASGKISGYYGTLQDITEMKSKEEELERYSKHLEEMVEEKVREISSSQMATIFALIKLSESRDDDTGSHIERTAHFCRLLAEKAREKAFYFVEIDDAFVETIYKASPLHDIGKVGIPDGILLKPGKLDEEEFSIMKNHVEIAFQTLAKIETHYKSNSFLRMGMDIALYHHEKWNGTGYNKGLAGTDIPLSARIMALADVYDALRSKRVYKNAFSHEQSLGIILEGRGTHFDPNLVDVFHSSHREFESIYMMNNPD